MSDGSSLNSRRAEARRPSPRQPPPAHGNKKGRRRENFPRQRPPDLPVSRRCFRLLDELHLLARLLGENRQSVLNAKAFDISESQLRTVTDKRLPCGMQRDPRPVVWSGALPHHAN